MDTAPRDTNGVTDRGGLGDVRRPNRHLTLAMLRDTLRYKPVQARRGFRTLPITLSSVELTFVAPSRRLQALAPLRRLASHWLRLK
jgi:hypothetical protein